MKMRSRLSALLAAAYLASCAGMRTEPDAQTNAAIAPTGTLRVGFVAAQIFGIRDPATGELRGVAVDLGRELGRRLGVPVTLLAYDNPGGLLAAAKSADWDVAMIGVDPERAKTIDFVAPYMDLEHGYLAGAGTTVTTAADIDRPGVRIGVLEKAGADTLLSSSIKEATLVRTRSLPELFAALATKKADVIASGKAGLFTEATRSAGTRVLDGRILLEPIALALPKGRLPAASDYLERFTEAAKSDGFVQAAIDRAALRGVVVAAPR